MSKSTTPITTAKLLMVGAFLLVTSTASAQFACINGLSPSTLSYSSSGGSSTVSLSVKAAGCSWWVSTNPSWLTVSPSSGMGAKAITITCTANTGGVRSGTVNFTDGVGTNTLTVQQACSMPSTPSGPIYGTTNPCQGSTQSYYISKFQAPGASSYSWTVPPGASIISGQGTRSISVLIGLASGSVSVTAVNACGSSPSISLAVTVNDPSQATGVSGSSCSASAVTLTATPGLLANSIRWYDAPAGGTLLFTGTSYITPPISTTTTYHAASYSTTTGCEASVRSAIRAVIIYPPAQPGTISGPDAVCQGTTHAYSITPVSDAATYTWRLGSTVTYSGSKNMALISFSTVGSQTVSVTANNSCGISAARTLGVSVNKEPSQPLIINGPNAVSQNTIYDYSVSAVSGATTYTWSVTGGTVTSGQGTTSPKISFNTAGSQAVSVTAGSSCGSSAPQTLSVMVKTLVRLTARSNYVYTMRLNTPVGKSQIIESLWDKDVTRSVTYFDGLGRPAQSISITSSPNHKDVVQPIVYDGFNRERVKYLPYTGGNEGAYNANAVADQFSFYRNIALTGLPGVELNPYAQTIFEPSPLNRVLQQGAPGASWQPLNASITGSGHTSKMEYAYNAQYEVLQLTVSASGQLMNSVGEQLGSLRYYPANRLYKNIVKNENWKLTDGCLNTTEEFKDKQGQVVLKRSYVKNDAGDTIPVSTYYAYDDFGLLRYVVPPKAVDSVSYPANRASDVVKNLCYYYQYDGRKRMIVKQLPGAEPVFMVYDNHDRLVLTQDGNMREDKDHNLLYKWMFTLYDALNRPVMTGVKAISGMNHDQLRARFNAYTGKMYDSIATNGNIGFTTSSFRAIIGTVTEADLLTITHYDGYTFPGRYGFSSGMNNISAYTDKGPNPNPYKGYFDNVKGKVTGTRVRVLETNAWLNTTTYYDDRYRPVQVRGTLYDGTASGGTFTAATRYHFNGQVSMTKQVQRFNGDSTVVQDTITYDHAWRVKRKQQKINGATTWTTISELAYNELGQLVDKKLGGGLQSVDYKYNIRGWLTGINKPDSLGADLFAMRLNYNTKETGVQVDDNLLQFNGNISSVVWNTQGKKKKGYAYGYDALNRLVDSDHKVYDTNVWGDSTSYEERGIAYDLNGNINHLLRTSRSGSTLNDFTYQYDNSNQLKRITDKGTNYAYDLNGNMTADGLKGFSVEYNLLNLPKKVSKGNKNVSYIYSAAGVKLAKFQNDTLQQLYAGSLVYKQEYGVNKLDYILNEEGMAVKSGGGFKYQYYLKDHLGNTRVTFEPTASGVEVKQVADYYPFGQRFEPFVGANAYTKGENQYLFGGHELQDYNLNGSSLDVYDFEARFYSMDAPRFWQIDPMAEITPGISPYAYCFNNPIRYSDPTGMFGESSTFIASSFINPKGTIIEHRDDGDPRVYYVDDEEAWKKGGKKKDGLPVIGYEDPNKKYKAGDQYTYYDPTKDPNYNGQYMIPSDAYDYSQETIDGKLSEDWAYYIYGGPWYKMGLRANQIIWRDVSAKDNRGTVVEAGAYIFLGRIKVDAKLFHRVLKPQILKATGGFAKVVGKNPDIIVEKGMIILKGTGPFKGKALETGIKASEFFK